MKFRWNKQYLGWGLTAFFVIAAAILLFVAITNAATIASGFQNIINAIMPIIYGFVFAYLFCPIVIFFETRVFSKIFPVKKKTQPENCSELDIFVKNKPARVMSIIVAVLIFIVILVGIISAIAPQLDTTIKTLIANIPSYVDTVTGWVNSIFDSYPEIGSEITALVNEAASGIRNFLSLDILPQVGDYLGFLTNGLMSLVGTIMNIVLGLVVSAYCLYSKELFAAQAKKVIYSLASVKHANGFIGAVRKVHYSFGNFITGTLIDSFIVGCITFVALTIFDIPFALLVSVIMGLTNIIPYFGPFIGAIPSAFLILMEDPLKSLIFIIIVLIIQNLNGNVISPKILGESMGLSSFWVIFAILAGQGILGFWGMIIGIPVFAVIYSAVKTFISSRLKKKQLPSDSECYTDIKCFDEESKTPVSLSRSLAEKQRIQEETERREKEEKQRRRQEKLKAMSAKNKRK
ncbi:MAG: AI-2E family transporter [Ruminiclostridium sp.]|nr:AI-2E family transporter [Ruminiclostridium sp.]